MPLCSDEAGRVDEAAGKTPEECQALGLWECDPVYYAHSYSSAAPPSQAKRQKRGKAWRDIKTAHYVCFQAFDGTQYRIGDTVYLESQQAEIPYFICGIQGFKMTKREQLLVSVRWYYRTCEVPETVYHTLVQDRHSEHGPIGSGERGFLDLRIRSRELFISDAHDTYSVSNLRGKCVIRHYKDIREAQGFAAASATFFYVLGYNPENNRLANIQGEIRVGPSHQAKLPEWRGPGRAGAGGEEWEEVEWVPGRISDTDLHTYVGAARSLAAFAGFRSSPGEDPAPPPSRDHTHFAALSVLHARDYAHGAALASLVRGGVPPSPETLWAEEEVAKFKKGLKQWGKNFFRIRKELLSHKTTGQLIEFYYLWKKSPAAKNQSVRARQRRPQNVILRRIKGPGNNGQKPSRPASSEFLDLSSASENEQESEDSDVRDLTGYACHHCYTTTSRDWHHAGKDRLIFCTDCRIFFKQYGELRPVNRAKTPPPYLFKPVQEDEDEGVRTRGRLSASKDRRRTFTPTPDMERNGAKSPSTASTTSSSSSGLDTEPLGKEEIKGTAANLANAKKNSGRKNKRKRRRAVADDGKAAAAARKKRKRMLQEKRASENLDENGEESESGPNSSPPSVSGENSAPTTPPLHVSQSAPVLASNPLEEAIARVNAARPAPVKMEIGDGEEEEAPRPKSPSVYEFSERDELAEPLAVRHPHSSPFKPLNPDPATLIPKAETSVITVNMTQKPSILSFGTNTKFERTNTDDNECSRTYLVYQRDPSATWINAKKDRRKEKASSSSVKQETAVPEARPAETSAAPKAASVQPSPLHPSPFLPPAQAQPPPWMVGGGMEPMMQMMLAMQGGGMNPFGHPGNFPAHFPGLNNSAVHQLRAFAEASQQQNTLFFAAANNPELQNRILDGEYGPEARALFPEFVQKNGIRQHPDLAFKTEHQLRVREQHQHQMMQAHHQQQMMASQAAAQAQAIHAQKQAQAQQQAAKERERERERAKELERLEKERKEREQKEREQREREAREREEQARLAAAAAAAKTVVPVPPSPSIPPSRVTPNVAPTPGNMLPTPGPPPSIPPHVPPFLNGMPGGGLSDPVLLQRMHEEQRLQDQRLQEQFMIQQLQMLANTGNVAARDQLAMLGPLAHHTHHHAHAHTHLHLTAQLPGAPSLPDGLKPGPRGLPPTSTPSSEALALHLQASAGLRPPGLHLPIVSTAPELGPPGFGFPGHLPPHSMAGFLEMERLREAHLRQYQHQAAAMRQHDNEMMRRLATEGTGASAPTPNLQPPPHP